MAALSVMLSTAFRSRQDRKNNNRGWRMADEGRLLLHYRGGEADKGTLDCYAVAESIMAFSDLIGVISAVEFGGRTTTRVEVSRISPSGSVAFEFAVHAGSLAQAILAGPATPGAVWDVFKESVKLWRFLGGSSPKSVEKTENNYAVTNINGQVEHFAHTTVVIVNDARAGQAIERLIKAPTEKLGLDEVEVEELSRRESVRVVKSEAGAFTDVSREAVVIEGTTQKALAIEYAVFVDGNKWRFSDGENHFQAAITDESFLARIDNGEPFAKGDMLVVELKSTQRMRRGKLQIEHVIVRVQKHVKRSEQIGLI